MDILTRHAPSDTGSLSDVHRISDARSQSFSYQENLLAALSGFRFLVDSIGVEGLQSWISSHPSFPAQFTTTSEQVLAGVHSPAVRRKFAALGGGQRENFTAFVALKMFGTILGEVARPLVQSIRNKRLARAPRYHFFAEPDAICADIDCTGVALVGLHRAGALSADELRRGAEELLASAAAESLTAAENYTHGKQNGPLIEGVFKVYWDDAMQPGTSKRGRKHDPTCVANALHAVLLAAQHTDIDLDTVSDIHEIRADGSQLRRRFRRSQLVARNIEYLLNCLDHSAYAIGTRYYPSPDAFLCFASMLVRDFPDDTAILRAPLLEALSVRWHARPTRAEDPGTPETPINLAMRIIAAQNLGVREAAIHREKVALMQMQRPSGAWPAAAFFKLGSMDYYFGSEAMTTLFALRALLGPYSLCEA